MNKFNTLKATSLGLACALSGCQAYLERNDGVTGFAGDAQAANEIKMADDPWKQKAYNDHLHGDSKRLSGAVERYKAGGSSSGNGTTQSE